MSLSNGIEDSTEAATPLEMLTSQQARVDQYVGVTNQNVRNAIAMLQKYDWNPLFAINRFEEANPALS